MGEPLANLGDMHADRAVQLDAALCSLIVWGSRLGELEAREVIVPPVTGVAAAPNQTGTRAVARPRRPPKRAQPPQPIPSPQFTKSPQFTPPPEFTQSAGLTSVPTIVPTTKRAPRPAAGSRTESASALSARSGSQSAPAVDDLAAEDESRREALTAVAVPGLPAGPHPVELAALLHELSARLLGSDDIPQALDRLVAFAAGAVPGTLRCSVALINEGGRKEERKGEAKEQQARAEERADEKAEEVRDLERRT